MTQGAIRTGHKAWIIPASSFLAGVVAAGLAQFGADWLTDARRGNPQEVASSECIEEWRDPVADAELLDIVVAPSADTHCWTRSMELNDARSFDVQIRYGNFTDHVTNDVTIGAWLPDGVELVARTTKIRNTANPDYLLADRDEIMKSGVNIGNYAQGAVAYVGFKVKVTSEYEPACGVDLIGVFTNTRHPNVSDWVSAGVVTEQEC